MPGTWHQSGGKFKTIDHVKKRSDDPVSHNLSNIILPDSKPTAIKYEWRLDEHSELKLSQTSIAVTDFPSSLYTSNRRRASGGRQSVDFCILTVAFQQQIDESLDPVKKYLENKFKE